MTIKSQKLNHYKDLESLGAEDGATAYRTLCRIEKDTSWLTTKMCNENVDEEFADKFAERIHKRVARVFGGNEPKGFFINYDPRGYALKIKSEVNEIEGVRIIGYTDWGGYGILAPEISE